MCLFESENKMTRTIPNTEKSFNQNNNSSKYANKPSKIWLTRFIDKSKDSRLNKRNTFQFLHNFFTLVQVFYHDFSNDFIVADYILTLSHKASNELKEKIEQQDRKDVDDFIEAKINHDFLKTNRDTSESLKTSKLTYSCLLWVPNDSNYLNRIRGRLNLKALEDDKFSCIDDIILALSSLKKDPKIFVNFDVKNKVNYLFYDYSLQDHLNNLIAKYFYLTQSLNIISDEYQILNHLYNQVNNAKLEILSYKQQPKNYEKAADIRIKYSNNSSTLKFLSNDLRKYSIDGNYNSQIDQIENGDFYEKSVLRFRKSFDNEIKETNTIINHKINLLKSAWDLNNIKVTRRSNRINTFISAASLIIAAISLIFFK